MLGLSWFVLGVLCALASFYLYRFYKTIHPNSMELAGLVTGASSIIFALAWGAGSVLEGEPRAASMGMLLFGLAGLVLLTVSFRRATASKKSHSA